MELLVSSLSSPFSFRGLLGAHCGHRDHRVAAGHGLRLCICPHTGRHRGFASVIAVDLIVRLYRDTLDLAGVRLRHGLHRRRAAFPSNESLRIFWADLGLHDLADQETGFVLCRP